MKYQFVKDNEGRFKIEEICSAMGICRSGYYCWRHRAPSARRIEDEGIKGAILKVHKEAKGRYGHRPMHRHLKDDEGIDCGRDRALRLMREMGIKSTQSKRFKPLKTNSNHPYGYSPNVLKKHGQPTHIDEVWVADTTYLRTLAGWMYLATVMDLFSRRLLGWSVSNHNDAKLVGKALKAAAMTRGTLRTGIIHHSDRGSPYASDDYQRLVSELDMKPSMSAQGNCYDNAAMESFYGRFKTSTIRGRHFADERELRSTVFEYVEIFYNRYRKHSSLSYQMMCTGKSGHEILLNGESKHGKKTQYRVQK